MQLVKYKSFIFSHFPHTCCTCLCVQIQYTNLYSKLLLTGNSERGEGESGVFVFSSDNVELLEDQSRVDRGAKAKQNCNSEKLMNWLNKLQVFSPESVIVIAASKKFDNIC